MTHPYQHSKPVRLAHAALRAGLARDVDKGCRYIERIAVECGGQGLTLALMTWADAYIEHATDGADDPQRVKIGRMAWIRKDTGQLDRAGSDRLPPEIEWAGRLIEARAALDEELFNTLVRQAPTAAAGLGLHIGAVLDCVAETINGLPRGFARMGATA